MPDYLLAIWTWTSHSPVLGLSLLLCKIGGYQSPQELLWESGGPGQMKWGEAKVLPNRLSLSWWLEAEGVIHLCPEALHHKEKRGGTSPMCVQGKLVGTETLGARLSARDVAALWGPPLPCH